MQLTDSLNIKNKSCNFYFQSMCSIVMVSLIYTTLYLMCQEHLDIQTTMKKENKTKHTQTWIILLESYKSIGKSIYAEHSSSHPSYSVGRDMEDRGWGLP
jgi:hypothetical protein